MKIAKAIDRWYEWYKAAHSVYSLNTLHTKLKVWSKGNRSKDIRKVTWQDLHEHVNVNLLEKGLALGTVKQHLAALNSLFYYLTNEAIVTKNPAASIRIDARSMSFEQLEPPEKVPIKTNEYVQIMAHLGLTGGWPSNEFWRVAVPLGFYCGLRISDCLTLEYDCFSKDGLIVHTKKRLKRVMLPWDDPNINSSDVKQVRKWVSIKHARTGAWLSKKPTFVFKQYAQAYKLGKTQKYSTAFERLTKSLGITNPESGNGKSFHMLRHSFVTRLADKGVTIDDIAKKVGHSSTKTTQIYNHGQHKTS